MGSRDLDNFPLKLALNCRIEVESLWNVLGLDLRFFVIFLKLDLPSFPQNTAPKTHVQRNISFTLKFSRRRQVSQLSLNSKRMCHSSFLCGQQTYTRNKNRFLKIYTTLPAQKQHKIRSITCVTHHVSPFFKGVFKTPLISSFCSERCEPPSEPSAIFQNFSNKTRRTEISREARQRPLADNTLKKLGFAQRVETFITFIIHCSHFESIESYLKA